MLPPPPEVKRRMLCNVLRARGIRTLVETGTFYGDTTGAVLASGIVDEIHTIESDGALAAQATSRFSHDPRVTVHHGDSATILPEVIARLPRPALFWLDAHWMGGQRRNSDFGFMPGPDMEKAPSGITPVERELFSIFGTETGADVPHVVAVDDAHLFGFDPAYPSISDVSRRYVLPGTLLDVLLDVIWIHPAGFFGARDGIQWNNGKWYLSNENDRDLE